MDVMLTAFEPFAGERANASWEAVSAVADTVAGCRVRRVRLPVAFGRASTLACEAQDSIRPAVVVCVGEWRGACGLAVERVALNLASGGTDEAGCAPRERPLAADAPFALASTLPVEACCRAALDAGVPAHLSCSAGLFVCNSVLFGLLDHGRRLRERKGSAPLVGFVHVPVTPDRACPGHDPLRKPSPSMAAPLAARGIEAVVACAVASLDTRP